MNNLFLLIETVRGRTQIAKFSEAHRYISTNRNIYIVNFYRVKTFGKLVDEEIEKSIK